MNRPNPNKTAVQLFITTTEAIPSAREWYNTKWPLKLKAVPSNTLILCNLTIQLTATLYKNLGYKGFNFYRFSGSDVEGK